MRKIILLTSLLVIAQYVYSQPKGALGADCNPKLNTREIACFDSVFHGEHYSFAGKTIGFAAPTGFAINGFNHTLLPIDKKEYFSMLGKDVRHKYISRLLPLTDAQKIQSKGFDAVILLIPQKKERKVTGKTVENISTVLGYRTLNYPENTDIVVNNTSPVINEEEGAFFNRIFHHQRNTFDFTGKKVAFIDTREPELRDKIKTKPAYVDRIKKHLENDFLFPYDYMHVLTAEEKTATGGYDAVVLFSCLKCSGKDAIAILQQSGT